jgi:hypothetical protein
MDPKIWKGGVMSSRKEFLKKINEVQVNISAPKSKYNKFGNYNYRNCEDILLAAKKCLNGLIINISDTVELVGDRFYIKATATITDGENTFSSSAMARESITKKGMDEAQITGLASSYARKFALCGLLAIDDGNDPDSKDSTSSPQKTNLDGFNREASGQSAPYSEFQMPFGKTKGKTLNELGCEEVTKISDWCKSKNQGEKFTEIIKKLDAFIGR